MKIIKPVETPGLRLRSFQAGDGDDLAHMQEDQDVLHQDYFFKGPGPTLWSLACCVKNGRA